MKFMSKRKKNCILKYKDTKNLLNKRNELIFKFRHRNTFKPPLQNVYIKLFSLQQWVNSTSG